jgi:two-component system, cell cycle sensor histidine kinase and response regulator CckA
MPVLRIILIASSVVELAAAILAVRHARVAAKPVAWLALAVSFAFMIAGRLVLLAGVVRVSTGVSWSAPLLHSALIDLLVSTILFVAVGLLGPGIPRVGPLVEGRATSAQAAGEAQMRRALDVVPDAFVVVQEGTIVFASAALARILGREGEVLEGRDLAAAAGEELASAVASSAGVAPPSKGLATVRRAVRARRRDGTTTLVDAYVGQGDWQGAAAEICLLSDATQRRRSEDALWPEERLFASGPVVLVRWRVDRSVSFVTGNVAALGFDAEALLSGRESFYRCLDAETAARVSAEAASHLAAGRSSWEQEYRLACPDGRSRWVHDCTVVSRDETSAVERFDGYLLDITSRRETEEALRASEERFRLAGNATREVIYDWDIGANRVNWSASGAAELGLSPEELGATVEAWEARIHPHDRDSVRVARDAALKGGTIFEAEYRFQRADGVYAVLFDRGLIVRNATGEPRRMVGAMLDLSGQRRLESQLTLSRRLEAVGSLAGGIAHDFNNLLTAILASAELLQLRLPADSPALGEIRTIKETSRRAADLTHALLAFARRQVLQPVDANLNEIVAGFLPVMRRLIPENVSIDLIPGHELGTVRVDRAQIEQILMNLCLNARDAMPSGGTITLETENTVINGEYRRTHPWAKEGRYVLLSLTDTGSGMDAETLEHVFEPFYTTKRLGRGVGLGLATVYGVVKQHDGMINLYSELRRGTTVKIYLPLLERRAVVVGTKVEGPVVGGDETVLVVEDDAAVRRTTVALLARLGYTVLEAGDGAEALALVGASERAPDLVVSDVVMPRMGGLELAGQVGAIAPDTLFLFASGYSENAIYDGATRVRGVHFIAKPYGLDALARKVRDVLDRRGRSE